MRLLITGGAGFIGSNFCRMFQKKYDITVLDNLSYAGSLANLEGVRHKFIRGNICDKKTVASAAKNVDMILNFSAETHVDFSIDRPPLFLETNVLGTCSLLEAARKNDLTFFQVSTDEVLGQIQWGSWAEDAPLAPRNPYSASKAAAEMLCRAFENTYGLKIMIHRSCNNFGPQQDISKVVPKFITNAIQDRPLPLYSKGENIREWIFVEDNCAAIDMLLRLGKFGETYHVGSGDEMRNIEIARLILRELGKPESLIQLVKDRPGHDLRYALNCEKLRALGWEPETVFIDGLKRTIDWYKNNRMWWETKC